MRDNKCEIKKMRNRKCEIIGGCSTLASVIPVEDYNHRRHVRTFREQFVEQIRRLKRAIHYLIHTATRSRHDWNNAGQSAAATNYLTFLYILIFLSRIFYLPFFISHFLSHIFYLAFFISLFFPLIFYLAFFISHFLFAFLSHIFYSHFLSRIFLSHIFYSHFLSHIFYSHFYLAFFISHFLFAFLISHFLFAFFISQIFISHVFLSRIFYLTFFFYLAERSTNGIVIKSSTSSGTSQFWNRSSQDDADDILAARQQST